MYAKYKDEKSGFFSSLRNKIMVGVGGFMAFILVIMLFMSVISVDAGEACVLRRGGDPVAVLDSGWTVTNPIGRSVRCYETRTLVYEGVGSDEAKKESKADFVDVAIDGNTVDGQPVSVTFSVRFRVKEENLLDIHTDIGADINKVNERVVKFHSRIVIYQVINKHTANDLYLGGLDTVSQEVFDILAPRFAQSNVTLEYVEIKRPTFSDSYTAAIEAKQLKTEEAAAAINEQEVQREKAETKKIEAQGNADAQVITAQGNADALAIEGEAYRNYPELMEVKTIEALREADLIILPNESMPILDLNKEQATPTPTPKD